MTILDELPVALPPEQGERYRAAWPSSDLLAETLPAAGGSRQLFLGCAADPICLVAARRAPQAECLVADDDAAAGAALADLAAAASLPHLRAVDPFVLAHPSAASAMPPFDFAAANTLYHPNKHVTFALLALAYALLAPGGRLYVVGAKDRGIRSIADEMQRLFGETVTLALRKGHRVVAATRDQGRTSDSPAPQTEQEVTEVESVMLRGQPLLIAHAPAVFAGGRVDPAAALLAETIEVPPHATVADLGCGAGVVGLVAARLAHRGHVYLLDASYAAIRLATENARRNGIGNVTALAGDAIAVLRARDLHPDVIVTNPPFHAGQTNARLAGERFMAGAAERLAPGGRLYLVANRFLPYERSLRQRFADVREVAGDARYKVLLAADPLPIHSDERR
jgi:16S rRNA (guanine1207-N2)-methyltransferase